MYENNGTGWCVVVVVPAAASQCQFIGQGLTFSQTALDWQRCGAREKQESFLSGRVTCDCGN